MEIWSLKWLKFKTQEIFIFYHQSRPVRRGGGGGGGGVRWVWPHPPFGGENLFFFSVRRYHYPVSGKLTIKIFKKEKKCRSPAPPPPPPFFISFFRTCATFEAGGGPVKKSAPPFQKATYGPDQSNKEQKVGVTNPCVSDNVKYLEQLWCTV